MSKFENSEKKFIHSLYIPRGAGISNTGAIVERYGRRRVPGMGGILFGGAVN
jgi:hypothetical protein